MKIIFKSILLFSLLATALTSCEEGENELSISLKSGGIYTSSDGLITSGETITIGVSGETEKDRDPLIKFNITESLNGGAATSVYTEDISTTEYEYDYTFVADTTLGTTYNYTFTITNKDGYNKQASLALEVQD